MNEKNNDTYTNFDNPKDTKLENKSNNLSKTEQSVSNLDRLKRICEISGIPYHSDKQNTLKEPVLNRKESFPPQNSIPHEQNAVQNAQNWQHCFGGSKDDRAYCIQQTLDGGYVVAGWTESNDGDVSGNHGGRDAWVMKLDAKGRLIWQRCLGGFSTDEAHYIQQTPDGGYIVAGKTRSNDRDVAGNHGLFDAWIVKLNSDGAIEWQRCIGGSKVDIAWCVQNTPDGGFIIAGETESSDGDITENLGGLDALVAKLDAHGEIQWHRILGGSKDDHALFISPTSDGGYIAAGRTNSNDGDVSGNHGSFDAWVVKLNAHGEIEWQRCLGGSAEEIAYCIRQTADGGYIFAGRTNSNDGDVSGNHGSFDAWVVKLNAQGDVEWQRCLGGSGVDEAYSIQQTSDGGYIVAGRTSSNDGDVSGNHGGNDAWIVKLDALGKIMWQRCLGGSSYDSAKCIQQTSDGGFIACGFTRSSDGDVQSSHGGADAWVVKLDADGNLEWNSSLDEDKYALTDIHPLLENDMYPIDFPLQDIISEKIDEAVVYIEGSNIESAMRMLQGVLELDPTNFIAKDFIEEINLGNIGVKSRSREMRNRKNPIHDPALSPPSLHLSEFHRPYDLILQRLYPDFEIDLDGFKSFLKNLHKPTLNLINKYHHGDPVDYNNPDLQAAYLLRYFPYYIETLQRILEKIELNNNLPCWNDPFICCFYGAGPAPEVLGLARYLKTLNDPPHALNVHFFDSGNWTSWRRFTVDVLLPHYNDQIVLSNEENVNMDFFDIVNGAQTNAFQCIRNGHVHIMQNCCTDFLRREKNMQNVVIAICNLFQRMAPGSLFVLSDVRNRDVPKLFKEIADTITGIEKTGLLVDDFDFSEQSYTPMFVVNPVVKEVLFDHESLRSRIITRYTTLVLKRT